VGLETLKRVLGSLGARYGSFECAVGWEYWAAGTGDGMEVPWMLVKGLEDVVAGFGRAEQADEAGEMASSSEGQTNGTAQPASSSPSPRRTLGECEGTEFGKWRYEGCERYAWGSGSD
jgi:hypothetical protein